MKMKMHYDRRPRTGIMLAYPFEEKRLAKWSLPYLVQPKYDGERGLLLRTSDAAFLISSTGLPIETMPHIIKAALNQLPLGVFDGELYIHGKRQRLASFMRRNEVHPDHLEAQFVIFDIKSPYAQEVRLLALTQLREQLPPGSAIQVAPSWACSTMEDITEILAEQMDRGFEGVIMREPNALYVERRATTMMKIKPRSSDIYYVVDTLEEVSIHNEPKGSLGALVLQDDDGRIFKVGSGFTQAQRKAYWNARDAVVGKYVLIKYQCLTDRGVPYAPIFVEVR